MKLTSLLHPLDFFDEANKIVFENFHPENLDYFLRTQREYVGLIQDKTLAFHFIMRYVDSVGLQFYGRIKYSEQVQRCIESTFN